MGERNVAESVTAPMGGRILKIECRVGERVEREQVLLFLEAMKMEVPVMAPVAGCVKEIFVVREQVVTADTVLAVIE